jgi:flagellar biosynthesis/type III secretory pathway chaperone
LRQELRDVFALVESVKTAQEELLNLSYEARRVILSGDTVRLSEIVNGEMRALSRINTAEKKRAALMGRVAALLGLPEDGITVGAIIAYAEPDERDAFESLQKELSGLFAAQREMNAVNQNLLEAQLEYTDAMMNVITPPEDALNNFYGGDGRTSDERRESTGFVDWQV